MKHLSSITLLTDLACVIALCVASGAGIFVGKPLVAATGAALTAIISLAIEHRERRMAFLLVAVTLLAAAVWEAVAMAAHWDIRVDLLVIYPALWIVWITAIMTAHSAVRSHSRIP